MHNDNIKLSGIILELDWEQLFKIQTLFDWTDI